MSGVYLFNKNQELIKSIAPDELTQNYQTLELNGQIVGYAEMKYALDIEQSMYFGVKDIDNFWMYKIRKTTKQNGLISLDGIHIFYDELKGKVIRDIRPDKVKANLVLERILHDTDWKLGATFVTRVASSNFYHVSALSAFYESLKIWDYEFIPRIIFSDGKIVEKKIDIYDFISKDFGKWYEYGDKLVDVVAESNTDELYTAFIGRGKGIPIEDENGDKTGGYSRKIKFDDIEFNKTEGNITVNKAKGIDYIEIKEATKMYGFPDGSPRIGVVDFDEIEDKKELAEATFKYALDNCRPKLQLKASALENERVELGETVAIIRPDMNIRYKVRVFKIKKDFLQDKIVSYEFGDKVVTSVGERLKAELYEKKKRNEQIDSYIDAIRDEINSSYFNDSAYNYDLKIGNKYNLPAGYYSFDKPIDQNPTKVIYMGAGKMLIANTKNLDGSWKWTTMSTGDGVAAESIIGTLGEFAKVQASQINVNDDFVNTRLGKTIDKGFKIIDGKIIDESGKIRKDLDLVDGKIIDLNTKAVLKDTLYNNVKITQQKGIQVIDRNNRERLQLGNWDSNRYGLRLLDESGRMTILDDRGMLQSWQDGRCDNADDGHPLKLFLYLPRETVQVYKASLRIYVDSFRAYSKALTSQQTEYTSTDDGGFNSSFGSTGAGGGSYGTTHGLADVQGGNREYPVYSNQPGWNGNVTIYHVEHHEHRVELPEHFHDVRIEMQPHSHRMTIPGHSHEIVYGIYEEHNYDNQMEILINGSDRTSALTGSGYFSNNQEDLNVTEYLERGRWNTIEIKTRKRMRIDASIYVQALLNYGGY